jgi:hypothetical protein
MKPFRVASFTIAFLAFAVGTSVRPVSAAALVGVKTTSLDEFLPSVGNNGAGDSYFAWSHNRPARPGTSSNYRLDPADIP